MNHRAGLGGRTFAATWRRCDVTTLSEVMRAEHVVHVALLKIDVEGHEIEVVSSSSSFLIVSLIFKCTGT